MLAKKNRVGTKTINEIFSAKKTRTLKTSFLSTDNLTFKYTFQTKENKRPQISAIIPIKISPKANKRNQLKRLCYDIVKKYIPQFPDTLSLIILFKKYQDSPTDIEKDIKYFLKKINE
jgi:RNase P protein component